MKPHLGLFGTLPPVRRLILEFIFRCRTMWLPARVLLGLGAAAVAALFRATFLTGLLGPQNPFIMFIVMVPLVTMLAGFTAGATMIVCGALLTHLLLRWPVAANDYVLLGAFIMSSGVIAATVEVMHRLRTRTQQTAIDSAQARTYRAFFSQAPVAIAMFDRDMRYLASSHLWIQLFSPDEPDLLGRCHYDVFPNLPQHWIDAHRRGLAGEAVLEQLDGVDTPPFGKRWFRWEVQPWRHRDGAIGGITIFGEDVTERVEKDLALRQSEARLRAFFANIGVGAVMLGTDGRFIEVSDHFCTMTGFTRAELVGVRTTSELTHEADRDADRAALQSYFAGESPHFISEKRYRRKDGTLIWVRVTAAPIRDDDGRIVQSAGIVENVTERKHAEDTLRKNEERMSLAFQATQDGIWDWNIETDEVFYSSRWKTMLGYEEHEIEPHISAWKRLVHPEDIPRVMEAVGRGTVGQADDIEYRMLHKDGHYVHILSRSMPVRRDLDGSVVRMVGTHFDLTEQRRREVLLRESEERLRLALSAGHMAIWDWDLVSGQVRWNDEHYMMLGYEPGSITPSYEAWTSRVHPSDREWVRSHLEETLKAGGSYNAVYRVLGDRNETRWLEAHGRVEVDAQGRAKRSYGVIIDITTRKQADELKAVLLQEVDHRAKNLLSVVQSIAQLTPTDGSPQQFLAAFNSRLQGLAASHDLLVNAEWKGVGVEELVRSQLPHFKSLIGSRILLQGASVTLKPAAAQAIGMAIHELATNAVKYGALATPDGIIRLSWSSRSPDGTDPQTFRMEWSEEGGPPVTPPTRRGFGYTVLVEMPEHILDARVELTYAPAGIAWRATFPLDRATV